MKVKGKRTPPIAERLLGMVLVTQDREVILGDLTEQLGNRPTTFGRHQSSQAGGIPGSMAIYLGQRPCGGCTIRALRPLWQGIDRTTDISAR